MRLDLVLDHEANRAAGLVKRGKPRRLHRADCPQLEVRAQCRKATSQELRTLPECATCAAMDR
jgi:hypothetical protein